LATTAIFAEILIAGLGTFVWLSLIIISVFGTDWLPADFLSNSTAIVGIGLFAIAYVLGILTDRLADSFFGWLKGTRAGMWLNRNFGEDSHTYDTPDDVGKMRLVVLRDSEGMSRFLDYQRSRLRIARATAANLAVLVPTLLIYGTLGNDVSIGALLVVEVILVLFLVLSLFAAERIGSAYIKRLSEAFLLLQRGDRPKGDMTKRVEDAVAAAVCFRQVEEDLEFLIVRTSDGHRWTFPKGHIKHGETPAEAAEREAKEEAGVRGIIEADPLIHYLYPKGPNRDYLVSAHLLRVLNGESPAPLEEGRRPRWFSPEEAISKLGHNRPKQYADEHVKVIQAALEELGKK
jgi:8-oxo-dGTP pyrophosphatase MutT (NUDIX family)